MQQQQRRTGAALYPVDVCPAGLDLEFFKASKHILIIQPTCPELDKPGHLINVFRFARNGSGLFYSHYQIRIFFDSVLYQSLQNQVLRM